MNIWIMLDIILWFLIGMLFTYHRLYVKNDKDVYFEDIFIKDQKTNSKTSTQTQTVKTEEYESHNSSEMML